MILDFDHAKFRKPHRCTVLVASFAVLILAGCGMTASPQPPSLQLPKPVQDVSAVRIGNQVHLRWTTPDHTTDKLIIHGVVFMTLCRQDSAGSCEKIASVPGQPGKPVEYTDVLPAGLVSGSPRPLEYQVVALNRASRNAGQSNVATVLGGATLPPVQQLMATLTPQGILLRWQKAADLPSGTFVELHRTLLTPPAPHAELPGLPPQTEPAEQTLKVAAVSNADPGMALDPNITFDRKYRYIAQRVITESIGSETPRGASRSSSAVIVDTRDIFPPAAPTGLAAVAVPPDMNNGIAEVDLSWSANTEPDFAGYIVYRRDANAPAADMRQISPSTPQKAVVAPAFRDLNVQPGHSYVYEVVAVDRDGNQSRPSAEATVILAAS